MRIGEQGKPRSLLWHSQGNEAVTQLDQVTQQNAALVEESAAASDSLSRQAAQLVESVRAFQLEAG